MITTAGLKKFFGIDNKKILIKGIFCLMCDKNDGYSADLHGEIVDDSGEVLIKRRPWTVCVGDSILLYDCIVTIKSKKLTGTCQFDIVKATTTIIIKLYFRGEKIDSFKLKVGEKRIFSYIETKAKITLENT